MRGRYGKPALQDEPSLRFNLSHSEDQVLYAFAYHQEVGIDIEQIRPLGDIDGLAHHVFSAQEQAVLQHLCPPEKEASFYACWTRKEAFIKALGMGFSMPLDSFDVTVRHDEAPLLLQVRERPEDVTRWTFYQLPIDGPYAATLAIEGHINAVVCWRWETGE